MRNWRKRCRGWRWSTGSSALACSRPGRTADGSWSRFSRHQTVDRSAQTGQRSSTDDWRHRRHSSTTRQLRGLSTVFPQLLWIFVNGIIKIMWCFKIWNLGIYVCFPFENINKFIEIFYLREICWFRDQATTIGDGVHVFFDEQQSSDGHRRSTSPGCQSRAGAARWHRPKTRPAPPKGALSMCRSGRRVENSSQMSKTSEKTTTIFSQMSWLWTLLVIRTPIVRPMS